LAKRDDKGEVTDLSELHVQKNIWMLPEEIGVKRPGIQNLAGMLVTLVQKNKGKFQELYDVKLYSQLKFSTLVHERIPTFVRKAIATLKPIFDETEMATGNGRTYIVELLQKLQLMSIDDFLALHLLLMNGPLAECFVWGERNQNGQVRMLKQHCEKANFIMGVKPKFENCFTDVSKSEAGKRILSQIVVGKVLPVWIKPLPPIEGQTPVLMDLSIAKRYMELSRMQRQNDEKGLSAWSCGFGGCGNPTKAQSRINKKLSMVIGLLQLQDQRPIIIHDAIDSEILLVHHQIAVWHKEKNFAKRWYFSLAPSQSQIAMDLPDEYIYRTSVQGPYHHVWFTKIPIPSHKAEKWAQVEREVVLAYRGIMGSEYDRGVRKGLYLAAHAQGTDPDQTLNHYHIWGPIAAVDLFTNLSVYTLGSAHNMYGVVSTFTTAFPFGMSDGSAYFHLGQKMDPPVQNATMFAKKVCQHNIARSSFFLSGMYYFNPRLNLLRRIKNRIVDFETGKVVLVEEAYAVEGDFITSHSLVEDGESDYASTEVAMIFAPPIMNGVQPKQISGEDTSLTEKKALIQQAKNEKKGFEFVKQQNPSNSSNVIPNVAAEPPFNPLIDPFAENAPTGVMTAMSGNEFS